VFQYIKEFFHRVKGMGQFLNTLMQEKKKKKFCLSFDLLKSSHDGWILRQKTFLPCFEVHIFSEPQKTWLGSSQSFSSVVLTSQFAYLKNLSGEFAYGAGVGSSTLALLQKHPRLRVSRWVQSGHLGLEASLLELLKLGDVSPLILTGEEGVARSVVCRLQETSKFSACIWEVYSIKPVHQIQWPSPPWVVTIKSAKILKSFLKLRPPQPFWIRCCYSSALMEAKRLGLVPVKLRIDNFVASFWSLPPTNDHKSSVKSSRSASKFF
jgi:hypothetical protein